MKTSRLVSLDSPGEIQHSVPVIHRQVVYRAANADGKDRTQSFSHTNLAVQRNQYKLPFIFTSIR